MRMYRCPEQSYDVLLFYAQKVTMGFPEPLGDIINWIINGSFIIILLLTTFFSIKRYWATPKRERRFIDIIITEIKNWVHALIILGLARILVAVASFLDRLLPAIR